MVVKTGQAIAAETGHPIHSNAGMGGYEIR